MWTVQSSYLVAMKIGTKLYEGRPHINQYEQTDVGSYKNLSTSRHESRETKID
jgi:hypothetical protein